MRVAIIDANIFIDFLELNWYENLFKIKLEIITTREVFNELSVHQQNLLDPYIQDGTLWVLDIPNIEHDNIISISASKKLSFTDKTVLFVAQRDSLLVITGDKILKSVAQQMGLSVNGILWVFERIIDLNLSTKILAAEVLEKLIRINTRLPMEECLKKIELWRKN
jgi:predicted nucleic acid-binding protein